MSISSASVDSMSVNYICIEKVAVVLSSLWILRPFRIPSSGRFPKYRQAEFLWDNQSFLPANGGKGENVQSTK